MKEMKRILSLFLCLAMLVGYMPVGVLAAEDESATEPSVTALVETTEAAEETTVPETTVPETTVPETTVPETTVPETTVPETTVPETTVPETTVPETTVPVTTAPETTEATQPEETAPVRKPVKKGATKVKKEATGAQDATKDYLFLATDFHDDGDIIDDMIGNMEANIGAGQLDYLGLGGSTNEEKLENLIAALTELMEKVGIKKTIRDYGVDEADFLARLDEMTEQAFDDQCTGANPRYPLMSEIRQMYLDAYYGN